MKVRKKLKIAATTCKQLGKQITEVRGSEEPEKKLKPKQSPTFQQTKTIRSVH